MSTNVKTLNFARGCISIQNQFIPAFALLGRFRLAELNRFSAAGEAEDFCRWRQ